MRRWPVPPTPSRRTRWSDAAVPTLLLRGYLATGRADLGDALGLALAQALERAAADTTALGRAAWLTLLVEASIVADDERCRRRWRR